MSVRKLLLSASGFAAIAGMMPQAHAQQLEEITVTARKVEENLMQVPIAITAFSAKDLNSMGVTVLNDIARFTPGFNFVNQTGGSGRNDRSAVALTFRGLFINVAQVGTAGGGAVFIDGAPVISAQGPSANDVERIEVLKGPQSVFFGRSTFSGAINYVTRDPSDEFKGRITAEYGSYGSNEETISVEGPIIADKLNMRLSGRYWNRGGQWTNNANTSEKLGQQSTKSVSHSMVFKPTDSLKIKTFINYFEDRDGAPAQGALLAESFNCRFTSPNPGALSAAALNLVNRGYICGVAPNANDLSKALIAVDSTITPFLRQQLIDNAGAQQWTYAFDPHFNQSIGLRRQAIQAHAKIDYETQGGYALSSLTAFHKDKSQTITDLLYRWSQDMPNPLYTPTNGRLPYTAFHTVVQAYPRDWSQELRIASPVQNRFRWTVGGNFIDVYNPGSGTFSHGNSGILAAGGRTTTTVKTTGVFAGAYYDFTPELTLTAEGRYQWDKIHVQPIGGAVGGAPAPLTGLAANPLDATYKSFSPRVSLDWKYAANSTAYALFSRGYRPGGFNTALSTNTPAVVAALIALQPAAKLAYEQEKLDNWEIGLKSSFLDGRARTTIALYYDRWSAGQAGTSVTIPNVNIFNIVVNSGLVEIKGAEFEGQFQATEQLKLAATVGFNDSKIKTTNPGAYICADCNVILGDPKAGLGNRLPTTPKWTFTVSAEYSDRFAGDYDWYTRVDASHRSSNFTDYTNVLRIRPSTNVNLRLGVRNEVLSIEAFATNLLRNDVLQSALYGTDVRFFVGPVLTTNAVRFSLPLKRMFGIRASYNF